MHVKNSKYHMAEQTRRVVTLSNALQLDSQIDKHDMDAHDIG